MLQRIYVRLAIIALVLVSFAANAEDQVAAAEQSTLSWLALLDEAAYDASWDASASMFQERVTRAQWAEALGSVRPPLGALLTRSRENATHTTSLPGAPDGDYVVFQFAASFENKASAVETVTTMKETDGSWRVAGYFIR